MGWIGMVQKSSYIEFAEARLLHGEGAQRQSRSARLRSAFAVLSGATDVATILASVLLVGWAYHLIALGERPDVENLLQVGAAVALFMLVPNVMRSEYVIGTYLEMRGHVRRTFQLWNLAFLSVIVLGFLTKTSITFSRGTMVLFYVGGFLALAGGRYLLVRLVQIASKTGTVSARRIFLVGFEKEIMDFAIRHQPWNIGMEIAGLATLPEPSSASEEVLEQALHDASIRARNAAPDDIFVLVSWNKREIVEAAIEHLMTIPASIHLGSEPLLERFSDVRIARVGTVASVQVVRKPMGMAEVALKRLFDLVVASAALLLLLPLFALIALAIRLDSAGPVFFLQRRYGFNQKPFRIAKFRTMFTLDDGDVIQQAKPNDARITRVGRFLRRWNLDELPQLWNVIEGSMSLVGPRPHALAHDHAFERKIALYARRHNVKPGITGWAQVNGFRGETSTDEKMRLRVEHDLQYIDNWSLWFDLSILIQTVLSRKAYRNAG